VPSDAAKRRGADPSNRGRYERWIAEGFIEACPGVRIEQAAIKQKILELRWRFTIVDLAYDKWNAEALRQELESEGVSVSEFGQTIGNFTDATKELIASVCDHSVDHGHNPVMRWMASNLSVYTDANENMRPDKKHSADKIDGMVAWLMAMSVSAEQVKTPRMSSW
jgi:phage terminase large subunit-like protein